MIKLTKADTWELFNRWIFMDIVHFVSGVEEDWFTDDDGYGRYIYADKKCNLYIDEQETVDIQRLADYGLRKLDDFIGLMSNEKYHLIGVFWYNK